MLLKSPSYRLNHCRLQTSKPSSRSTCSSCSVLTAVLRIVWISGNTVCQLLKQSLPPFWESIVLSPWKGGIGDSYFLDNLHLILPPSSPPIPFTHKKKEEKRSCKGCVRDSTGCGSFTHQCFQQGAGTVVAVTLSAQPAVG